ncbi:TetR/AcrR family transcriptional regulator [Polaromonas jejuensis]|uniref:TetR/AcrR family transcriptional regulator n=1 Tax=Polaromonas jejuensis TaxID=457502 RepID=A0ABW0QC32_9BURK|nr:TetR/AcrR family transcriptional regulator [Polaromonas jejuensis]
MPDRKSSAHETDAEGRSNQKRRTRQALIDAALALREEGRDPTFAEVAERALVSRATAYRYFSSVEALVSETAAERAMPLLEHVYRPGDDPAQAIGVAARELNKILLDDEVGLHVMERSFMAVWLENERDSRPARPGRRMKYIRPIVDALKDELPPAARQRLSQALSMVMGSEAVLAVRDIAGASVDEAIAAGAWAAQALVKQALAEADEARMKRGASRRAASPAR